MRARVASKRNPHNPLASDSFQLQKCLPFGHWPFPPFQLRNQSYPDQDEHEYCVRRPRVNALRYNLTGLIEAAGALSRLPPLILATVFQTRLIGSGKQSTHLLWVGFPVPMHHNLDLVFPWTDLASATASNPHLRL